MKDAKTMRAQAASVARLYASERLRDGDPEGSSVIRELANAIMRIPLREPK